MPEWHRLHLMIRVKQILSETALNGPFIRRSTACQFKMIERPWRVRMDARHSRRTCPNHLRQSGIRDKRRQINGLVT